eukprot:Skav228193  [mRNA]  locus=scaffold3933:611644:617715:+ [translate_table: standard]
MTRPQLPIEQRLNEAPEEKKSLRFEAASAARQHPFKEQQQYIYADAVCCGNKWLGVCDGVSGVQKMGIAPDVLPRELLLECQKVMESSERDEHGAWVLTMLKEAFAKTTAMGATTVLLACIEDAQRLALITLGDCGLLQLRPTNGDELRCNLRWQRVMMGEKTPAQVLRLPHQITGEQKEIVEDCRLDFVNIKHGDLIVLGSDGLFDNLSDEAISHIAEAAVPKSTGIETADDLSGNAFFEAAATAVPEAETETDDLCDVSAFEALLRAEIGQTAVVGCRSVVAVLQETNIEAEEVSSAEFCEVTQEAASVETTSMEAEELSGDAFVEAPDTTAPETTSMEAEELSGFFEVWARIGIAWCQGLLLLIIGFLFD